jgi:iron complex outermembrane receptor protein
MDKLTSTIFASTAVALAVSAHTYAQPVQSRAETSGRILEEVIVTVSKRQESVQDIAASVAPLQGDVVDALNVLSVSDIANTIPNVVAKTPEKLSIRGIAAAGFQGSNAPQPVAQHENGLFIAETGVTFPYYDIGSIEVLRGPSGTVFGRNATAGAIDVRWQEPQDSLSASLDYQLQQVDGGGTGHLLRGFANVPIAGEHLLARAAFAYHDRAATFDNLAAAEKDDPNARERQWYRIYLASRPSDDVALRLRYIHLSDDRNSQVNSVPLDIRRSGLLESLGGSTIPQDDVTVVNSNIIGRSISDLREEFRDEGGAELNRVDGDVTWWINDLLILGDVEVFAIAGYSDSSHDILIDTDGTELSLLDTFNAFDREQFTTELRISSAGDQELQWIFGVFYSKFDMDVEVALEATALDSGLAISLSGTSPQSTRNTASAYYGNLEWNLAQRFADAPDITLFGGLRANRDETDFSGEQVLMSTSAFPIGMPQASFPLILDVGAGEFDGDDSFDETTGEFGLRYQMDDDVMLYAKYSKGYKAGKLQQIAGGDIGVVDPEILDAYEIGMKSRWLDQSLQLNAAAFYYDYADLQITQLRDALPIVENAADARIFGVELDAQYLATDQLLLTASLGYLDTEFKDFCAQDPFAPATVVQGNCDTVNPQDLSGNELPDAPNWSATLVSQYTQPLADYGEVLVTLRSTYRDAFYTRPQNLSIDEVNSHTLTDFRLQWISPESRYEVSLFVENIEDEGDLFLSNVTLSSPGLMSLLDHVPGRRYGASIRYNFN